MLEDLQDASLADETPPHIPLESTDRLGLGRAAVLAEAALRLAQRLREGGLDEAAENAGSMARAAPLAYFGGTVILGVALARFLKASSERARVARAMHSAEGSEPF